MGQYPYQSRYSAPYSYGREAVDAELARLREDAGRVSEALLELTEHPGQKLLDSAPLSGVTAERWQRASARMAALWDNYTAFQDVLNRAAEIRGRRTKPHPEELSAIMDLLRGPSITLSSKAVALSQRTLLGPSTVTETATLAQTLERMNADYQAAADFIAAADAAWNRLFQQADPVQERLKELIATVRSVGDRSLGTSVARLGDEYTALRREVFADPVGLSGQGSNFSRRLARIAEEIEALFATASGAVDLRADFERQTAHLGRAIDRLAEVEAAQPPTQAAAREKIAVGALPEPTRLAPNLRRQLDGLSDLRDRGQWTALAEAVADLDARISNSLALATRTHEAAAGLLARREELRGRLAAYRVRAARSGAAEDQALEAYYQSARELLWSQPCDLAAATRALAAYQKAVLGVDGRGGRGGVV